MNEIDRLIHDINRALQTNTELLADVEHYKKLVEYGVNAYEAQEKELEHYKQAAELAIEAVDLAISMVPQNRVATKIWWEMVEKVEESKELMK